MFTEVAFPGNTPFADPSSWSLLKQRFTRPVSDDIQDIYDGMGYMLQTASALP